MTKPPSLYELNPAVWDAMAEKGRTGIAEMARIFDNERDMDAALGATHASWHWMAGRNNASMTYERRARLWLAEREAPAAPQPAQAAPSKPSEAILMVIPPLERTDAVRRVLAALGCQVVDVE